MKKVYKQLASLVNARENCRESENRDWFNRHEEKIKEILKNGPSGSGIDFGTKIDLENSNPEKLVFICEFHHMDGFCCYDGWTYHKVIVKPSLSFGFNVSITGKNKNDIKDYLTDVYWSWLNSEIED